MDSVTLTLPTISVTAAQVGWLAMVALPWAAVPLVVGFVKMGCAIVDHSDADDRIRDMVNYPALYPAEKQCAQAARSLSAELRHAKSGRRWFRLAAVPFGLAAIFASTACLLAIFNGGWQ